MLSLQYIWISSRLLGTVSHPNTWAHVGIPHVQCVCACVHIHTHKTYTSTPCKRWGDTFLAQTIFSRWKRLTNIDQLMTPTSILFYVRLQWNFKHLWLALKTPVQHTYAKRRWPPQNESKWWLRRQAWRQRRAETDANVNGPTHLFSVWQRAGTSSFPKSSTPQPPSLLPNPGTAHGSFLLSQIMIIEDPLSSQIAWPELNVAHVGPVRSCREAGGIQWCRRRRAFSLRIVQKYLHLHRPITQLQP